MARLKILIEYNLIITHFGKLNQFIGRKKILDLTRIQEALNFLKEAGLFDLRIYDEEDEWLVVSTRIFQQHLQRW